jgi:hypothetical protein
MLGGRHYTLVDENENGLVVIRRLIGERDAFEVLQYCEGR